MRRSLSETLRRAVWRRDHGRCEGCGKKVRNKKPDPAWKVAPGTKPTKDYQVDHRLPVAFGGKDAQSNLRLLCTKCHQAKTTREAGTRAKVKRIRAKEGPKQRWLREAREEAHGKAVEAARKDGRPADTGAVD